jgi:hypothetical protein
MKGKNERKQGWSDGRMDEWGRKADRKIDNMKVTLNFLNIANASKIEKKFRLRVFAIKL